MKRIYYIGLLLVFIFLSGCLGAGQDDIIISGGGNKTYYYNSTNNYTNITSNLTNETVNPYNINALNLSGSINTSVLPFDVCTDSPLQWSWWNGTWLNCYTYSDDDSAYLTISAYNIDFNSRVRSNISNGTSGNLTYNSTTGIFNFNTTICNNAVTSKLLSDGTNITCGTDQTGSGSGAPTDAHYILTEPNPNLPNAEVIGDVVFIYEQFYTALTTFYTKLGTESVVTTTEPGLFGVHSWASGTVAGNDGGFSLGGSTVTTDGIYNLSKFREIDATIKFFPISGTNGSVGIFNTTTTQVMYPVQNGFLFNFTNTTNNVKYYWNATSCDKGKCTVVNTTIQVSPNWFRFKINRTTDLCCVQYYINQTQVANISTNISTNMASWVGAWTETRNTTAKNVEANWFYFEMTR